MNDLFAGSVTLGVVLTIITFEIGLLCQKKWKHPLVNPMLISILLVILFLLVFDIEYDSYNNSGKYITYILTPTTVSLAIPLYEQMTILKKNFLAIIIGILSGVIANLTCIFLLSLAFGLNHLQYVTLLPKSITTAIAIGLIEELDGVFAITIVAITITGLLGNIFAITACKLFRIKHPVSQGLALGNAAHAMGTSKIMELGELQGAMGGLAVVVAGLSTTILASIYATFI